MDPGHLTLPQPCGFSVAPEQGSAFPLLCLAWEAPALLCLFATGVPCHPVTLHWLFLTSCCFTSSASTGASSAQERMPGFPGGGGPGSARRALAVGPGAEVHSWALCHLLTRLLLVPGLSSRESRAASGQV